MQKVTVIPLPEELVNYLQRLDYEIAGLQVLHTHALSAGTPEDKLHELRRELQEVYAEYQLAKQELWAPYDKEHPNCRWRVDFQEGVMRIEE